MASHTSPPISWRSATNVPSALVYEDGRAHAPSRVTSSAMREDMTCTSAANHLAGTCCARTRSSRGNAHIHRTTCGSSDVQPLAARDLDAGHHLDRVLEVPEHLTFVHVDGDLGALVLAGHHHRFEDLDPRRVQPNADREARRFDSIHLERSHGVEAVLPEPLSARLVCPGPVGHALRLVAPCLCPGFV